MIDNAYWRRGLASEAALANFSAMRVGARGYLFKGLLKAEVLRAVRGVVAGRAIFGSGLAHDEVLCRAQTSLSCRLISRTELA